MFQRLRQLFGQPSAEFRPTFRAGQRNDLTAYDGQPFEVVRHVYSQGWGEFWLIRFRDRTEHHVEPECVEIR